MNNIRTKFSRVATCLKCSLLTGDVLWNTKKNQMKSYQTLLCAINAHDVTRIKQYSVDLKKKLFLHTMIQRRITEKQILIKLSIQTETILCKYNTINNSILLNKYSVLCMVTYTQMHFFNIPTYSIKILANKIK